MLPLICLSCGSRTTGKSQAGAVAGDKTRGLICIIFLHLHFLSWHVIHAFKNLCLPASPSWSSPSGIPVQKNLCLPTSQSVCGYGRVDHHHEPPLIMMSEPALARNRFEDGVTEEDSAPGSAGKCMHTRCIRTVVLVLLFFLCGDHGRSR